MTRREKESNSIEGYLQMGSQLRQVRKLRRLTLVQTAAKAGVSKSFISRLETNENPHPNPRMLKAVTDALGLESPYFGQPLGIPQVLDILNTLDILRGQVVKLGEAIVASQTQVTNPSSILIRPVPAQSLIQAGLVDWINTYGFFNQENNSKLSGKP